MIKKVHLKTVLDIMMMMMMMMMMMSLDLYV